jgi:CRP-like cAMP-binding protein
MSRLPPSRASHKAFDFLRNLPAFKELGDVELQRIAASTGQVRAPAGTIVFRRGEMPSAFHVVVYGQVKLALTTADGAEKVIEILGPGMSFGEAVMFLERPYLLTAETLSDTLLLAVGKQAFLAELDRTPVLARRVLTLLSARVNRLIQDVEALSLRSATERVIGYLLRNVPRDARDQDVDLRLTTAKGVIASRLNITREHFSRILHELAADGLIEVRGRAIHIVDLRRLREHGR